LTTTSRRKREKEIRIRSRQAFCRVNQNYFSQFTDDAVAIIMQLFGCIIIAFACSCGEGRIKWTLKASNQGAFFFHGDELKSFEM
jgi:hypothetical protein